MKPTLLKSILKALPGITACWVLIWFAYVQIPQCFDGSSPADFPNYYFTGNRLFEGRPIYSNLRDEVMTKLGWQYDIYPADPPFAIVALSPLSLLPYKTAWWTLAILSFISLCIAVLLTTREVRLLEPSGLIALSLALLSPSFLFLVKRNHFEMALVLCSVLGWMALRRGRPSSAGILFGIAGALKLFPMFWLLAPFILGGRRPFLVGGISFCLLSAIGGFVVGAQNMKDFVFDIIPLSSQWYGTVGNYSLISFCTALGIPLWGLGLSILVGILGLYDLLIGPKEATSVWIRVITLSLLLSPLSWLNYNVLLIPIAIVVVSRFQSGQRRRLFAYALCIMLVFWPSYVETPIALFTLLGSYVPTFALVIMYFVGRRLTTNFGTPSMVQAGKI